MKIIDLLNNIADGLTSENIEFELYGEKMFGISDLGDNRRLTKDLLNCEVEIIKEDKKIEQLVLNNCDVWTGKTDNGLIVDKINEIIEEINKLKDDRK